MCQWLAELKHQIAALQVCPWGSPLHPHTRTDTDTHTHTHALAKQLSRCHKHYNQVDKDSALLPPSSLFFLQLISPLPVCLSSVHLLSLCSRPHTIQIQQMPTHCHCVSAIRAGRYDLKSTAFVI